MRTDFNLRSADDTPQRLPDLQNEIVIFSCTQGKNAYRPPRPLKRSCAEASRPAALRQKAPPFSFRQTKSRVRFLSPPVF